MQKSGTFDCHQLATLHGSDEPEAANWIQSAGDQDMDVWVIILKFGRLRAADKP